MMSLTDLAYEYVWDNWGDKFIRDKAESSLVIDIKLKCLYVQKSNIEINILSNLTDAKIRQIIKLFGCKI